MSATQDYVALDWIKGEISQTLEQAQFALEAVAESPEDTSSMRSCLTSLHQVHGTLKMVELSGPSQVADEMEQLAQALMNESVPDVGQAQEILMQTILQMPGYLDLIQREQNDSEKNYLPLVNNLRIARGEERIGDPGPEEVEASPNLSPIQDAPSDDVIEAYIAQNGESNAPKLRQKYQQSLTALLKKSRPRENLSVMGKVFAMLIKLCGESPMGNLSRLGLALVEGVGAGAIRLSAPVAKVLKAIDSEVGKLAEGGSAVLSEAVPSELALEILEILEDASKDTAKISAAKKIFASEAPAATAVTESITIGPDDETLAAVAGILIEELHGLVDKLDLYVRSSNKKASDLIDLLPGMKQISGTLAVVGLAEHQEAVDKQVEIVRAVEKSGENPEEETLLDMAKDLLGIEAALGAIAGDKDGAGDADSFGDLDEAQAAVVRETRNGLGKCRDSLIEFVSSDFDHSKIENLPAELSVLRGGLLMVNQTRSGDVLIAAARYTEEALLKNKSRPELSAMDDLADAITSIDYFLERLLESSRDPYIQMIEVAEEAVEKLGFKVGSEAVLAEVRPVEEAPVEEADLLVEEELEETEPEEIEPEAVEPEEIELEAVEPEEVEPEEVEQEQVEPEQLEPETVEAEEIEPQMVKLEEIGEETEEETVQEEVAEQEVESAAEPETAPEPETSIPQDENDSLIDEEILEIFVEEVDEVLENIGEYFPQWKNNTSDSEALTELRRAFHTLKGSGRMVGATVLGELAWSVESMLNGVLENTISVGEEMLSLVSDVIDSVPEGLEFFKNQNQQAFLVDAMVARAETIIHGKPAGTEEVKAQTEEEIIEAETVDEEIAVESPDTETVDLDEVALEEIALSEPEPEAELEIKDEEERPEALDLEEVEELEPLSVEESPALDGSDLVKSELDEIELDEVEIEDVSPAEPQTAEIAAPEEEVADSEDIELDEIFLMEASERLEVINQFLASPDHVTGDLVAAFHTLKGSGAMAGVESIAIIAAPLEHLANHYLTSNRDPDESLLALIDKGNRLIKAVTADLATHRNQIAGMNDLVAEIEAAETSSPDVLVEFNFENIDILSEQDVIDTAWEADNRDRVRSELQGVFAQAESLSQIDLANLIQSLLRIHDQVESLPNEEIMVALKSGHRHLVRMFDHIAASQEVEDAVDVIAVLDALDLSVGKEVEIEEIRAEDIQIEEQIEEVDSQEPAGQALPEDQVDEDILPIFLEEADELLEGIDQSILDWSENSAQMDSLDLLLRHLHTLKGGSRMAGLNSLGEFTHNFETYLIGVQQNPVDFDLAFFGLLNERQDDITRRVEIYKKFESGQATEEELASLRIEKPMGAGVATAVQAEQPQAPEIVEPVAETSVPAVAGVDLPADEIDEDVMPIFLEETDELMEGIDESILGWSEETTNPEFLNNLLRHLHTLKGGARMAGMNSLGEFTHNFETFLIGLQQNPVDLNAQFFSLLNQRQDEITRRVGIYSKMASGDVSEDELSSLTKDVSGETVVAAPDEQVSTDEPKQETKEAPARDDTAKAATQSQEMVRVSADLLEELEGLAGESSIIRGRVEQQITDFGESLQEMEDTIHRIRDQVRRLEIEAESRETLIRSQSSEDSEYDELEMDRYTMLQEISRTLNESSSDLLDLKETLVNRSRDTETLLHQQARIGSELQEGLTRTRMVPFARLIPRLRRIVRQISAEIDKSVRFDAFNIEGELDRNVLERIIAPLEHMLRNSVDHGIESAEIRKAAGKPEEGRISLRISREGGYVILDVSDDGGGINVDAVRSKAIERGLMTEDSSLTDNDIMQFILNAGFSTATKVTQISGRGVGMDVVVSEIKSLGGSISIDSTLGVGTEFTIRIPFTVSINRALMVVVKEETYAVPLNTIEGIVRVSPYELEAYYQPDAPMFEYAGQPYHLDYMGKLLEKSEVPDFAGQVAPLPVLLARSGDSAVAIQVDRVIGSREVVVKTLGPQFNGVGGVAGATVLGDGRVVIILDVMALVRTHEIRGAESGSESLVEPEAKVRTIMIVDDSVTVRKVTSRLMERQGWEVATAKDGLDAVNQLQDFYPDVVLLDIEMPKMDGFEVLKRVRHDERLKDLPIIMITSRTGEKHKQEALELGVNRYLGKPFQEANLLSTIEEVISEASSAKP